MGSRTTTPTPEQLRTRFEAIRASVQEIERRDPAQAERLFAELSKLEKLPRDMVQNLDGFIENLDHRIETLHTGKQSRDVLAEEVELSRELDTVEQLIEGEDMLGMEKLAAAAALFAFLKKPENKDAGTKKLSPEQFVRDPELRAAIEKNPQIWKDLVAEVKAAPAVAAALTKAAETGKMPPEKPEEEKGITDWALDRMKEYPVVTAVVAAVGITAALVWLLSDDDSADKKEGSSWWKWALGGLGAGGGLAALLGLSDFIDVESEEMVKKGLSVVGVTEETQEKAKGLYDKATETGSEIAGKTGEALGTAGEGMGEAIDYSLERYGELADIFTEPFLKKNPRLRNLLADQEKIELSLTDPESWGDQIEWTTEFIHALVESEVPFGIWNGTVMLYNGVEWVVVTTYDAWVGVFAELIDLDFADAAEAYMIGASPFIGIGATAGAVGLIRTSRIAIGNTTLGRVARGAVRGAGTPVRVPYSAAKAAISLDNIVGSEIPRRWRLAKSSWGLLDKRVRRWFARPGSQAAMNSIENALHQARVEHVYRRHFFHLEMGNDVKAEAMRRKAERLMQSERVQFINNEMEWEIKQRAKNYVIRTTPFEKLKEKIGIRVEYAARRSLINTVAVPAKTIHMETRLALTLRGASPEVRNAVTHTYDIDRQLIHARNRLDKKRSRLLETLRELKGARRDGLAEDKFVEERKKAVTKYRAASRAYQKVSAPLLAQREKILARVPDDIVQKLKLEKPVKFTGLRGFSLPQIFKKAGVPMPPDLEVVVNNTTSARATETPRTATNTNEAHTPKGTGTHGPAPKSAPAEQPDIRPRNPDTKLNPEKISEPVNQNRPTTALEKAEAKLIEKLGPKRAAKIKHAAANLARVAGPAFAILTMEEIARSKEPVKKAIEMAVYWGSFKTGYKITPGHPLFKTAGGAVLTLGTAIFGAAAIHAGINAVRDAIDTAADTTGTSGLVHAIGNAANETASFASLDFILDRTTGELWKGENAFNYFSDTTTNLSAHFNPFEDKLSTPSSVLHRDASDIESWNEHLDEQTKDLADELAKAQKTLKAFEKVSHEETDWQQVWHAEKRIKEIPPLAAALQSQRIDETSPWFASEAETTLAEWEEIQKQKDSTTVSARRARDAFLLRIETYQNMSSKKLPVWDLILEKSPTLAKQQVDIEVFRASTPKTMRHRED